MNSQPSFTRVEVVYQLSRDGKLEHPHMIEVLYSSDQDGLCLRDVKKRLTTLRGKGMLDSFSWSYKRSYKNTFIWNDLGDGDVIHPLRGSGEYVLKASELIETFSTKADAYHNEYQTERRHSSFTPSQAVDEFRLDNAKQVLGPDGCYSLPKHSRNVSFDDYSKFTLEQSVNNKGGLNSAVLANNVASDQHASAISSNAADASSEVENAKGPARGTKEKPPSISPEQETIDLEKPDFCLSSSDGEISPRQEAVVKEEKKPMVVRTRSSTVQEFETPPSSFASLGSPLHSPSSTRRLWKREIRKSLFRTKNCNSSRVSGAQENAIINGGPAVSSTQQDDSFLSDAQSKNYGATGVDAQTGQTEKPNLHLLLVKTIWSRWTSGSKSKGITVKTCDPTFNRSFGESNSSENDEASASVFPLSVSEAPRGESSSVTERSLQSIRPSVVERKACDLGEKGADALKKIPGQQASDFVEESITARTEDRYSTTGSTNLQQPTHSLLQPGVQQLSSTQVPSVLVLEETSQRPQAQPLAAEFFPKPAIARVLVRSTENHGNASKGLTAAGKPLPPGFHKGTNDTKPRTPGKSIRSPMFASSPPLIRSLSRNAVGSTSGRGIFIGAWRERSVNTKCTNFCERDERPLVPGLTNLDWERTLQEAVRDSLPPQEFTSILEECPTCGRTFKPDSLKVHMRGCHSLRNTKTCPLHASPHMLRTP